MSLSKITYSNYVADGPEAETIILEAKKRVRETDRDAQDIADPMWLSAGQDRNGRIRCFIADNHEGLPVDKMKEFGLKDRGTLLKIDNVFRKAYIPDRRYKAGKELERKMERVNMNAVSLSQALIEILGVGRTVCDGRVLARSVAGFNNGLIVVRIPGIPDDGMGDDFPDIRPPLREPQGEEWKHFAR